MRPTVSFTVPRVLLAVSFFFSLVSAHIAYAQQREPDLQVKLKGTTFLPGANAQQWLDSLLQSPGRGATQQVIVQFHQLPGERQKAGLATAGILLQDHISGNSYVSLLRTNSAVNAATHGIRSITAMQPAWKMAERLAQHNLQSAAPVTLIISFFREEVTAAAAAHIIQDAGAIITDRKYEDFRAYEISIPQNKVLVLAAHPYVKYLNVATKPVPLNDDIRASSGAELVQTIVPGGLTGKNVTFAVGDNCPGLFHVDTRDRVINFHPWQGTEHGSHVTGIAAGKGILDMKAKGMAHNSTVLGHLFDVGWVQTPNMRQLYNMTLTNNSYAAVVNDCGYVGVYDQYSAMLDELSLQYPEVQHVFAAGNDGLLTCGSFPQGYSTVNGGYQPSKNILVVGGLQKDYTLAAKSGRGPVRDGRLKPEIISLGWGIYSCTAFDQYVQINGTSMAAPNVTGAMALLTERYRSLHSNENPRGDVLKTIMMNGAMDMGNPGPDFLHGFGLLNVYRSLQILDSGWYMRDSVNNGGTKSFTINIPANTSQAKIMLYWHDVAASPTAATQLVNDLDLTVTNSSSVTSLPLILDPSPGGVGNVAQQGADHTNNVEQVVIDNPQQGTYTVEVKGTNVTNASQPFVVAFDFIPNAVKLHYPVAGTPVIAGDSIQVYWEASEGNTPFTIEFSDNGGANWTVLAANIPATDRRYFWYVPAGIATSQARVRITRGTQQDESGDFVVAAQSVVQLAAIQCPGYMSITWDAAPGVNSYEVMRKIGDDMHPVAVTSSTSYVFSGLSQDSVQYVAVRPLVNGKPGFRSRAVKRQPNDGSCAGSISDNDRAVADITAPSSGRKYTSTELTSNEDLTVVVHNLDDASSAGHVVHYSINGGPWQSQSFATPVAANSTAALTVTGADLSAVDNYEIRVAVKNIGTPDPVTANDSMVLFVRHLSNEAVDINNGYADGFEGNAAVTVLQDSAGVFDGDHWDLTNSTDSGRVRTYVSNDVLISGQRSISMDALLNLPENQSYLTGTFNLDSFDVAATEARVELRYKIHGQPKYEDGNEIWVRGNDNDAWLSVFKFDTAATPGEVLHTGSLSITDAFISNGQQFSSSFQVRIGQHDTSAIAFNEYGNGLTLDDFKLYSVKNDVQLLSVVSPLNMECGLSANVPVTVEVYNSDNLPQYDVELFYRFDNGTIFSQTIDTLDAKENIILTFTQTIASISPGAHKLDIWLVANGDTYLPNDSIMNYTFRNQPVISGYPYLENFDSGDGYWFTGGRNSSWEYGIPNSTSIKMAASGTKVWATKLEGNYNDNEESYLYSPCFDVSGLTNPMLSFSLYYDIEDCGNSICDRVFVEYSADGTVWTKLDNAAGGGYNWYNHEQGWKGTADRWLVASIPLPVVSPSLKLRFVLQSDPGTVRSGVAIDDIHIFNREMNLYNGGTTTAQQAVTGNGWVRFSGNNEVLAEVNSNSQQLGTVDVRLYKHTSPFMPATKQYNLERSFVINSSLDVADSVGVRLYVTDEEVYRMIHDGSCSNCLRAPDAYRLGITKYDDPDKENENGSLSDNRGGVYSFIPHTGITWVPYEKGYYAEATVSSFSEFWFSTGIPTEMLAPGILYPNPVVNHQFNLLWSGEPGTKLELAVFDILGRKMHEATATATDYDNKSVIQLPPLQTGIYFVRYILGGEVRDEKILVR